MSARHRLPARGPQGGRACCRTCRIRAQPHRSPCWTRCAAASARLLRVAAERDVCERPTAAASHQGDAAPTSSIGQLSGGNQQKVLLGRALAPGGRLLLLNEPTRGVDIGAKAEIHHLINELTADGAAVLMVSSDLPELLGISDRVYVLGGRSAADRRATSPDASTGPRRTSMRPARRPDGRRSSPTD